MSEICIVRPSGRELEDLLAPRLVDLEKCGFRVTHADFASDHSWTYTSGSKENRFAQLDHALKTHGVIWAARGGYGASDLLPLLDAKDYHVHRWIVGFSDISALHAYFYKKNKWPAVHGPMPATSLWRQNTSKDIDSMLTIIRNIAEGRPVSGTIDLKPIGHDHPSEIDGKLFGGCFTVLSNLIGTPYFPSLSGHIIFLEDLCESPARILRQWNQWLYSGVLDNAKAIVLGNFIQMGEAIPDNADYVIQKMADQVAIPVFKSECFGHVSPNHAMIIGAQATISKQLHWTYGGGNESRC